MTTTHHEKDMLDSSKLMTDDFFKGIAINFQSKAKQKVCNHSDWVS